MASNPTLTTIPGVNEPFIDPRTKQVSRSWRLFLQSLFTLTGSGTNSVTLDDLQIGPNVAGIWDEVAALMGEQDAGSEGGYAELEQMVGTLAGEALTAPQGVAVAPVDIGGTGASDLILGYVLRGNGGDPVSASPIFIDTSGRVLIGATTVAAANWENEFRTATGTNWPLALNCVDRGLIIRNSANSGGTYVFFEYNGGVNNGSITWSGATTSYNTSSDYRLKTNLSPLTGSGAFIDALKCYAGTWKADGRPFVGMLAHEVQEVTITPAVFGEKDGEQTQAMDYSSPEIITHMITEIQSLRARVAALEEAA